MTHYSKAWINNIAEEGSKEEAVRWLITLQAENDALKKENDALKKENDDLRERIKQLAARDVWN